jgi:hypothetical protein
MAAAAVAAPEGPLYLRNDLRTSYWLLHKYRDGPATAAAFAAAGDKICDALEDEDTDEGDAKAKAVLDEFKVGKPELAALLKDASDYTNAGALIAMLSSQSFSLRRLATVAVKKGVNGLEGGAEKLFYVQHAGDNLDQLKIALTGFAGIESPKPYIFPGQTSHDFLMLVLEARAARRPAPPPPMPEAAPAAGGGGGAPPADKPTIFTAECSAILPSLKEMPGGGMSQLARHGVVAGCDDVTWQDLPPGVTVTGMLQSVPGVVIMSALAHIAGFTAAVKVIKHKIEIVFSGSGATGPLVDTMRRVKKELVSGLFAASSLAGLPAHPVFGDAAKEGLGSIKHVLSRLAEMHDALEARGYVRIADEAVVRIVITAIVTGELSLSCTDDPIETYGVRLLASAAAANADRAAADHAAAIAARAHVHDEQRLTKRALDLRDVSAPKRREGGEGLKQQAALKPDTKAGKLAFALTVPNGRTRVWTAGGLCALHGDAGHTYEECSNKEHPTNYLVKSIVAAGYDGVPAVGGKLIKTRPAGGGGASSS